jgi:hypothetical protein
LLIDFQKALDPVSKREYKTRTDEIPPDAFRDSLLGWAKRLGELGGKPRKNRFAPKMDIDEKTLKKYLDREPGLWEKAIAAFQEARFASKKPED